MFTRGFHPARFLRTAVATGPFREYCRSRGIVFTAHAADDVGERWRTAIDALPADTQARVDLELAQVNELATPEGAAHLVEAAAGGDLPPDHLSPGPALALWFFLRRPTVFQAVFFQHEVSEVHSWRAAQAAVGLPLDDLSGRAARLGDELRRFFRRTAGTGRFCAVDARRLPGAVCFVARVADRVHLIEGFSAGGELSHRQLRPALTVIFVYDPADGSVQLKAPVRAADRIDELFCCCGRAVLGQDVTPAREAFDLDRLMRPFHPLPDREDMESVRVKTLYLRYPERFGRRRLKLETPAGDARDAIEQMIRSHLADRDADLQVGYAEIQVGLRTSTRSKFHTVRLWPDRCNLNHSPLGRRLRSCLKTWGLTHA